MFRAARARWGRRGGSENRLRSIQAGERLSLVVELNNPVTRFAVQLQTHDYYTIGWAPRYLVEDLAKVMAEAPHVYEAHLIRVNPAPAPYKQRFLVELKGKWPEGFKPMSSPEFEPVSSIGFDPSDTTCQGVARPIR